MRVQDIKACRDREAHEQVIGLRGKQSNETGQAC